jgi:undecaprenyl-diphosphatase
MTPTQAIILGILQGITEFLPISSSGHLVLVPNILGWEIPADQSYSFNILLQAATLIAVASFFFQDFISLTKSSLHSLFNQTYDEPEFKLAIKIILSTIPAVFFGILLNGYFEKLFNNPLYTSCFLLGTATLLIIAEKAGKLDRDLSEINNYDAIWIGIFQIFALLPGISRSGSTIAGGMVRNLERESAARYSFLISFPILLAAGINGLFEFIALPNSTESLPIFLIGSIFAAGIGFLSIKWLLRFLSRRSLYSFAIYCIVFACINLLIIANQS